MKIKEFRKSIGIFGVFAIFAIITGIFSGCQTKNSSQSSTNSDKVQVTDFSGNKISINKKINNVVSIHPIFTQMTWSLAPSKLKNVDKVFKSRYLSEGGTNAFSSEDMNKLKNLPVTNAFFQGVDPEQITKLNPDILITISKDPNLKKLKQQLNVPILVLSKDSLNDYEKSFRILGKVLGNEKEANNLADYWKQTIAEVSKENEKKQVKDRPKVYYAGSEGSLQTVGSKTIMASIVDTAGGNNVSDELTGNQTNENAAVSMEQVILWNPDIIILQNQKQKDEIMNDNAWKKINAVKNGKVYVQLKYAQMDGVTALSSLLWCNNVINQKYNEKFNEEMKTFYLKFFKYNITKDQLAELQK